MKSSKNQGLPTKVDSESGSVTASQASPQTPSATSTNNRHDPGRTGTTSWRSPNLREPPPPEAHYTIGQQASLSEI